MDNWWLAVLEYYGILTYEEADHLSEHIKNSIGNSQYRNASKAMKEIMDNYYADKHKEKKTVAMKDET